MTPAIVILVLLFLIYVLAFSPRSQFFGKVIFKAPDSEKKFIALSFDDGPNDPYTTELLQVLDSYGVKATFFLVGSNVARFPDATQRVFAAGHVIGNHSYDHSFLAPLIQPDFQQQILKTQDEIERVVGKRPALYRPPWFLRQPMMLQTAASLGMHTVTGTFGSSLEVFQLSAAEIAQTALRKARPGAILVFHDGYNSKGGKRGKTVEAVRLLIPKLVESGYTLVTIPEMLAIQAYQS